MNRKQEQNEKKHNYFYKITNLINGKFYYGIHSTNNIDDDYMGSGRIIKEAIKKHGKENFNKEIIADYPTRKEASDYEREIITMDLILDENCYNLRCGGDNENKHSTETRRKISQKCSGENHPNFGKQLNDSTKQKISEAQSGNKNHRFGKKNTPEHRAALLSAIRTTRKCIINGIVFNSIKAAAEYHNVSSAYVCKKLKSTFIKWLNWSYVDEETLFPLKNIKDCRTRSDFNYRKERPLHEIEKIRQTMRNRNNSDERVEQTYIAPINYYRCKMVSIEGQIFFSVKESSYILKLSDVTIRNRCKSLHEKWKNWIYL